MFGLFSGLTVTVWKFRGLGAYWLQAYAVIEEERNESASLMILPCLVVYSRNRARGNFLAMNCTRVSQNLFPIMADAPKVPATKLHRTAAFFGKVFPGQIVYPEFRMPTKEPQS